MPYKSQAQQRFFHSAGAKAAGLTDADVAEWDQTSKGMNLPERATTRAPRTKTARNSNARKKTGPTVARAPKVNGVRKISSGSTRTRARGRSR